jgi:hypothetical protein
MAPFSGQTQGGSAPDEPQRRIPELEEALRRAEDSSRNKSAFIANLSHEIRTPLNSIIGVANLFQGTRLDLEQKKFVEMLSTSARDLHRLVEELLDLSLIETGRLTLQSEPFPVRSNCSRTIRPLAVSIQERRLSLELQVDPAVPEYLGGTAPAEQIQKHGDQRHSLYSQRDDQGSGLPGGRNRIIGEPSRHGGPSRRRDGGGEKAGYGLLEHGTEGFFRFLPGCGHGASYRPGDRGSHGRETLDRVFGFRRQDHSFPGLPGKDTLRRGPSGEGREIGKEIPEAAAPIPAEIS